MRHKLHTNFSFACACFNFNTSIRVLAIATRTNPPSCFIVWMFNLVGNHYPRLDEIRESWCQPSTEPNLQIDLLLFIFFFVSSDLLKEMILSNDKNHYLKRKVAYSRAIWPLPTGVSQLLYTHVSQNMCFFGKPHICS